MEFNTVTKIASNCDINTFEGAFQLLCLSDIDKKTKNYSLWKSFLEQVNQLAIDVEIMPNKPVPTRTNGYTN